MHGLIHSFTDAAIILLGVSLSVLLQLLFTHLLPSRRSRMQAKFTVTFTEVAPVPPITLTTTAFSGIVGSPESGSLGPQGGNGGPYTVTVDPATPLPDGVTMDSAGNISGTPTTPVDALPVNVTVADSQG